jgi:PGF-CTERM protein
MTRLHLRLSVFVALVFAAALVAGFASVGAASHGSPANFTVYPQENADRDPSATQATYVMSSAGADAFKADRGLEIVDYYWLESEQADFSACAPDDARVFGIDRGNNNTGTQVDESLLQHMKNYNVNERRITLDLYGPDDFGGDTINLYAPDATVAVLGDCVENTGGPGWYQFSGFVNGTTYAGNYEEVHLTSHYFWVGDFENEEEARAELGPPPSAEGDGSTSEPTPTSTPTPTATEASETSDSTATPTTTATSTATGTATPADGGNDGSEGPSDTEQTEAPGGDSTGQNGGGTDGESVADMTPTPGEGPGFGAIAALVGLLAAGLLVARHE